MATRRKRRSKRRAASERERGSEVHRALAHLTKGEEAPAAESSLGEQAPKASAAVSLEAFLVSCQKSLARSALGAQQASKADSEFAKGARPVYVIDGLDIDLSVAVAPGAEGLRLDFAAPLAERSRIKFRVESRPMELLTGAKVELANMDSLGVHLPDARLRAWIVDPEGRPVHGHPMRIYCVRAGDKQIADPIEVRTDAVGRVDFFISFAENRLKVVGDRRSHEVFVQGGGRGKVADEYFVWAVCEPLPTWSEVSPVPAPQPPALVGGRSTGEPGSMTSELVRIRAKDVKKASEV
jgi:hypothetical protein